MSEKNEKLELLCAKLDDYVHERVFDSVTGELDGSYS